MIWPFRSDNLIERRFDAYGLNEFLELSLGIGIQRATVQSFQFFSKESCSKLVRGFVPGIQVDGTSDGFQGICERGFPVPTTVGLFTTSHMQIGAEANATGDAG